MSELPVGWAETTLSEITMIGPKSVLDDDLEIGFVPMSHAPTNFRDSLRYEARAWGDVKKAYTHFKNGDVIFAKVTPCFENGKAALVSGLPHGAGAGSSEFHVLRPATLEISAGYLLAIIKSSQFLSEGEENMTGAVGLRRVPRGFIENFPVNLPPTAEQKRIAQKLDELLAQVDTLKARIDAIPALLKRFRQSVLAAAVSGTLPSADESVLGAVAAEHRVDLVLDEERISIPTGWTRASLGQTINPLRKLCYGVVQPGADVEQGVEMIRVCDIDDGQIAWGSLRKITDTIDAEYRRSRVQKDDVVVSIVGSIGRAAIVRDARQVNIARAVARISPDPTKVLPEWLYYWLSCPMVQWWLVSSSKEVARKTLNLKELSELPVALPPLSEQTEIVRRVEQLFAFADQLEAKVATAKQRIDTLTQSILAKAFRGELVPQDPNDEPASVLLERIRAQRAAAPKPRRAGRLPQVT